RLQIARYPCVELGRGHRLSVDDLEDGVEAGCRPEGRTAGEALVEDRSQRIDVGCRTDVLVPLGLLRRHVRWRPHHRAGVGLTLFAELLGETEVGDLG